MNEAVDDDTLQAVIALWKSDKNPAPNLASVFKSIPETGRLKSPQTPATGPDGSPYAVLDSQLLRRQLVDTGGAWFDYRKVTITVRGVRADVVSGLQAIVAVFNPACTLVYPSGARFMRWWPTGRDKMTQDPATKDAKDIWVGIHEAEVWSVRTR